ncbi:electron transport complex, RnfABCDGE type, C subunit [Mahella australiensis 50-1 BON]|uniref:Ion-translocating oxidoreductase complex subunit C n=1 Tax=Mahella australiensis (strain DSM 15567 / CIP 107919 / 50-1 BON) TaxID=697281 RepID=F3ZVI8_MAHA5|nr:electron transport complex, RnfABCDGE type, C subunit [Mahella australiensis 50-1 BON]
MKTVTFKGGIHPRYNKEFTASKPIRPAALPRIAVIPLQQHVGAPCKPLVKAGNEVKVGQKIGEAGGFVSVPVHASVSGKVVAVEPRLHPSGQQVMSVVIESDGQDTVDENVQPKGDIDKLSDKEIIDVIKEAGIAGLGGAAFPTHVKLSPPPDKRVELVIINGAECEPYLTCDHRLMLEQTDDVVYGTRAIMKALGVSKGIIAIENNKPDAIAVMLKAASGYANNIEVVALKTKYPQGAEKQLIKAITGKEVPSGGLPADVGTVVDNVGTAAAIARAIKTGMPLIERAVTVTGRGIKEPANLMVRIGTPFSQLIDECGGFADKPGKVIMGGPMMGIAQYSLDVPVIKGTSGILVLTEEEAQAPQVQVCIRCARCVEACPMGLLPLYISRYALAGMYDKAEQYNAMDCIECGCCSFECPAKRPLVESIRLAKRAIAANRRKAG